MASLECSQVSLRSGAAQYRSQNTLHTDQTAVRQPGSAGASSLLVRSPMTQTQDPQVNSGAGRVAAPAALTAELAGRPNKPARVSSFERALAAQVPQQRPGRCRGGAHNRSCDSLRNGAENISRSSRTLRDWLSSILTRGVIVHSTRRWLL